MTFIELLLAAKEEVHLPLRYCLTDIKTYCENTQ